jgi:ABC-2 type transport system ATP-binding protein
MSAAIELENLSKTYKTIRGPREALKKVSLNVPVGHVFGFAGPNGAGKSTALKILVGLVQPTSGTAQVFGHPCGSSEARATLGFLPEVTLYHEFMSVLELLRIHAHLAGVPSSDQAARCQEVLEDVDLWERRSSRIKELSKGMKQRFGIAQALVGRPRLLILDELTSGLDPHAQQSLLSMLANLAEKGITIFFSSHHLSEIERVCDSVAILHLGQVRASGTLEEILGDQKQVKMRAYFDEPDHDYLQGWEADIDGSYSCIVNLDDSSRRIDEIRGKSGRIISVDTTRLALEQLFYRLTGEGAE